MDENNNLDQSEQQSQLQKNDENLGESAGFPEQQPKSYQENSNLNLVVAEKLTKGQTRGLVLGTIIVLGLFGTMVAWVITHTPPPTDSLNISQSCSWGFWCAGDLKISLDREDYKISYLNAAGEEESFYIAQSGKESPESDPLTLALIRHAKTSSSPKLDSPFSGVDGGHKIISLTLDVSLSTRNLINVKDGYYRELLNEMQTMLTDSEVNLRPGDEIRVGFLGRKWNTGSGFKTIDFAGPNFDNDFEFTSRRQISVLSIKNPVIPEPEFDIDQNRLKAYSIADVMEAVHLVYSSELENNKNIQDGTFLISGLEDLSRVLVDKKKFSSIIYIISTDGDFHIRSTRDYCWINTYPECHARILRKYKDVPILQTLSAELDRAYVVGVEWYNNDAYRESLDNVFKTLLQPIPEERIKIIN